MTIPNISVSPTTTAGSKVGPHNNPIPPADSNLFGGGYDAANTIIAGANNLIKNSRACSIIQGYGNKIEDKVNTHIIGSFTSASLSDAFYVGCLNGLHVNGDVLAFTSSDERLKDDITLIENPLSKVLSLDAVEFNWNDNQEVYSGHDIGLIAQQVEEVAPEIVTTRENGFKAVKYDRVTSLLVGAIKEQQKIIESLEERISKLEN
jgi:hypothetical protein